MCKKWWPVLVTLSHVASTLTRTVPPPPPQFGGNHQAPAIDMGPLIARFLEDRGTLLRGMAHPLIFGQTRERWEGMADDELLEMEFRKRYRSTGGRRDGEGNGGGGGGGIGGLFSTYGAVPVSSTAFSKLVRNGEAVLLYPGGAR